MYNVVSHDAWTALMLPDIITENTRENSRIEGVCTCDQHGLAAEASVHAQGNRGWQHWWFSLERAVRTASE